MFWVKIYSLHGPELLEDLDVARVKSFLVILSPLQELGIPILNESFKLAEDAAAELHITFSKLLGNKSAIRIASSSPDFPHNCHGLVGPSLSVYRLTGSNGDRILHA